MPSTGAVLKTPIADAISVGPKPAGPWLASGSGGSIIGRVVWVGGDIPNDRLPVASAFRQACCPDDTTKAFDRLTIDAASGGLSDCVVYLAGEVSMLPPASQPVEVSITHCQFDQRVALVPRGGTIRFVNTDDLAHNIRGRLGETLLWSRNLIEQGSTADFKVDKLGIVQTRSGSGFDWMDHYVWVIDHAGYALSDGTGRFVLDHIPAGTYTLHAWHPGIRRTTSEGGSEPAAPVTHFEPAHVVGGEITIREGRTTEVVIEMQ